MPTITLPDGKTKSFPGPVSGRQVAESIGPRLAKDALGVKIDGKVADLSAVIDRDAKVSIVTYKQRDGSVDPDALLLVRHSAAHVMAEAIQRLVPQAQLVYGPPLATGFYYDIRFPDNRPLKESDFAAIDAEMQRIIAEDRPFTRYDLDASEGMLKLTGEGNKYKVDNALRALAPHDAPEKGIVSKVVTEQTAFGAGLAMNLPADAKLSFYATGTPGRNWEDLCRGPHVPSTGRIGAAKVMSLASSYWHGDENSDRLTRVYGTAFGSQAELEAHQQQLAAARERDHRVIGKQLRLFHIDEMVGQGLILWAPAGAVVRQELQTFISEELRKQGYFQVFTPHIGKLDLYRTSGHFPYYKDAQYPPVVERETLDALASEGCSCGELANRLDKGDISGYLLKPMNCPHHIKIFASQQHSYRDLPVRLAEFGTVYRWEQSGEIGGMTRVRGFTQDDAHLFCTEEQVGPELLGCLSLVKTIFGVLGMKDYRVRVGLRDPDSKKYIGDARNWDKAEQACRDAARTLGVPFSEEPGEAAFYGPKIDFVVKDVIGREWQLGTVQVDYNLPVRFGLSYIGPDNAEHRPVMIHRAPFGSMERFCGVLIEHFAGAFPTWLSPEQARVLPISDKSNDYAQKVLSALKAAGVRATADLSGDRIQGKIKSALEWKIPYLLVVGPRDAESNSVSVRLRGQDKDAGGMPLDAFVAAIRHEIASRSAGLSARPG
ncbi:MAG: threonine--tRNA ligase [Phycisphaerae bacterium]|nr:threonine--tRNA ligase [Phycisphaerae bacterium]